VRFPSNDDRGLQSVFYPRNTLGFVGKAAVDAQPHIHQAREDGHGVIVTTDGVVHVTAFEHFENGCVAIRRRNDDIGAMLAAIFQFYPDSPVILYQDFFYRRTIMDGPAQVQVAFLDGFC